MKSFSVFILCASLLAGLFYLSCQDSEPRVWVFLGDSLTEGDGVADSLNFVSLLQNAFPHHIVLNQGRSGWSTASYLNHWQRVTQTLPDYADVFVIQLGANDLRVFGHHETTIDSTVIRLNEMINRLMPLYPDARYILMAPSNMVVPEMNQRLKDAGFGHKTNPCLLELQNRYAQVAQRQGFGFVTLYGLLRPGLTLDGAHPNEKGHQELAAHLARVLKSGGLR